jgi:hypothetical protein
MTRAARTCAVPTIFIISGCWVGCGSHLDSLTRSSAASAIEATAEFQHKTKLVFEIGQLQTGVPGVCRTYGFSPDHALIFAQYLAAGVMKFQAWGNNDQPEGVTEGSDISRRPLSALLASAFMRDPSTASIDMVGPSVNLLTESHADRCGHQPLTEQTGTYELSLGNSVVVVTGIKRDGNRAFVEFRWHFDSLNEVGKLLPRLRNQIEYQQADEHLSVAERATAPFWIGTSELQEYDDGWRVSKIELNAGKAAYFKWEYGPTWPDPEFNWKTPDENLNRF